MTDVEFSEVGAPAQSLEEVKDQATSAMLKNHAAMEVDEWLKKWSAKKATESFVCRSCGSNKRWRGFRVIVD